MIMAWHFCRDNRRLKYGDNREIRVGETLTVDGPPELCKRGLHGSVLIIDALGYAAAITLCRVEIGGEIVHGNDKLAGTTRRCVAMADATMMLHEFACRCAEKALALAKTPDPRSLAAIEAKRAWMRGEISDEQLATARASAWDAARGAACGAARASARAAQASARDAAWSAARAAQASARDAARDAAWYAAWYFTWASARAATWDAPNEMLTEMACELLKVDA